MSAKSRRQSEQGQVLPVAILFMALLMTVMTFFFNVVMFRTNASIAIDGALRAGGLAALAQTTADEGYSRWYVDPKKGTRVSRDFIRAGLSGYDSLFTATLFDDVLDPTGTGDVPETKPGVDIEIIAPKTDPSQTSSAHFYNCDQTPVVTCSSDPQVQVTDVFPEAVLSEITNVYYSVGTIVLRARLPITQIGGINTTMTQIVVIRAGTDDAP